MLLVDVIRFGFVSVLEFVSERNAQFSCSERLFKYLVF